MFADRWLERTKEGKCCQSKRKIVKESLTRKRRERSGGSSLMLFSHSLSHTPRLQLWESESESEGNAADEQSCRDERGGGEREFAWKEKGVSSHFFTLSAVTWFCTLHVSSFLTALFVAVSLSLSLSLSLSNLSHSLSFFEPDYSRRQQPSFAQ